MEREACYLFRRRDEWRIPSIGVDCRVSTKTEGRRVNSMSEGRPTFPRLIQHLSVPVHVGDTGPATFQSVGSMSDSVSAALIWSSESISSSEGLFARPSCTGNGKPPFLKQ